MIYILLISVAGILLLQASGMIPDSSVGGPMLIALAVFLGAAAVAIDEAWRQKRGALGWALNVIVCFVAAFLAAPVAGFLMVMLLRPFANGSSLAAAGGPVFAISLTGTIIVTLLAGWGALKILGRWR